MKQNKKIIWLKARKNIKMINGLFLETLQAISTSACIRVITTLKNCDFDLVNKTHFEIRIICHKTPP